MSIDFKDSILGTEKEITLPTGKRLRVKIPAGIESSQKLRFPKEGSQGGDVYVQIQVTPDPLFTRIKDDIESEIVISAIESITGIELKIPTIDGAIMMKIPAFVNSGQKLRIAGKGVPNKGDHFIKIKIVNPSLKNNLMDEEFKLAIDAWSKRHPFNVRADGGKSK